MNYLENVMEMYLSHYNKIFWLVFSLAGMVFVYAAILGVINIFYLDMILGILLVSAGVHRIGEEFFHKSMKRAHDDSIRSINELLQWAEKSYDYTRAFKDRHEKRIHRLDQKRAAHEDQTEDQFRSAVKKIIEMENKLNKELKMMESDRSFMKKLDKTAKDILTERKLMGMGMIDLNNNQRKALDFLNKNKKMTNKDYRKQFKVSEKTAYNDIMKLTHKGLIKREGKGRNTYYTISF